MQPELIVAIVTGLITLFASFLIATYQTRTEFRKMAKQLEEKYTTSLFDKRLEVYPQLFKILNDSNNAIEYNEQSKEKLVDLQKEFDNWMSTNALFLTNTTARIAWGYHNFLIDILEQYRDQFIPEDRWIEIRNIQLTFGKFLRAELGIFDTEPAGIAELEKPYVKEILEKLGQSSKKIRNRFGY
ncbi:MAG: hypothetical protein HC875_12840 [Anaerolineales bacterium]|nr:hypothetical protein [Anaerolineales bacterium]